MTKSYLKKLLFLFLCIFYSFIGKGEQHKDSLVNITKNSLILTEFPDTASIDWVIKAHNQFVPLNAPFINFAEISKPVWLKAAPINLALFSNASIMIDQARMRISDIYFVKDSHVIYK